MSAITQVDEDTEVQRVEVEERTAAPNRPSFSLGRVVVGTGLATGAALLATFVGGLPVIAATAVGAGVGGGAVAMMAALRAPLRRYR
ncbi:MAG TPA: hypothetical protein VGD79_01355 [Thermoanaerobaculia bacterium]|jgi:hypothetical protein